MQIPFDVPEEFLDALADRIIVKLAASGYVVKGDEAPEKPAAVPAKAAPKAAAAKAAPKAAEAPKADKVDGNIVHKALRDYAGPKEAADYKKRRDAAMGVLTKFSASLAELKTEDYQKVIDGLKALDADADDDEPF